MLRQFLGLPFLSNHCSRAHTPPDPEAFFPVSWSISKQKFTSSPSLSFQALSLPENSDELKEGKHLRELQITVQPYSNIPKRLLKASQTFDMKAQYLCSASYNVYIAFKNNTTKYTLNAFLFLLKHIHKLFCLIDLDYSQKICRKVHEQVTNLSLHWN